jgi:hypothetical protein
MDVLTLMGALIVTGSALGISTVEGDTVAASQVEATVQGCGYASSPMTRASSDPPGSLPWLTPLESGAEPMVFFARDPEDIGRLDGRLFAVLVFPDEIAAERLFTAAKGRGTDPGRLADPRGRAFLADDMTRDRGPVLVKGASRTVWRGSVAAQQLMVPPEPTTLDIAVQIHALGAELASATSDQLRSAIDRARAELKPRSHDDLRTSPFGVDHDFVDCLDSL